MKSIGLMTTKGPVGLRLTNRQAKIITQLYRMAEDALPGCPLEGFSNGPHKKCVVLVYGVGGRYLSLGFHEGSGNVYAGFLDQLDEQGSPFCTVSTATPGWLASVRLAVQSATQVSQN